MINKLIKIVNYDISTIPDFIDGKNENHLMVWRHIQNVVNIFKFLITNQILTQYKLKKYNDMVEELILSMLEWTDDEILEIEISAHFLILLISYQEKAVEYEEYEVAQNIKNFLKTYQIVNE